MTSRAAPHEAYVWVWLPGATESVVAGRLESERGEITFNYGKSYLDRVRDMPPAVCLYEPELPLRQGRLPLPEGLRMPGCIRDASPDAWGRRVILQRLLGRTGRAADTAELDELTYLLESGSDRVGALDFQRSPTEYVPRGPHAATLEELLEAAERIERGASLSPELEAALLQGTSIGGARPKALVENRDRKYVAKFSSTSDVYSVVKAEFIAMRLAARVGLNAAHVELATAAGRDVLLVERFDRERSAHGWTRKALVSALTLLALDEMMARYASYETLAEIIRHRFRAPRETLRELFGRLVFNILCGNTDDHARNHSAFWDGSTLALTPAYDLCPQMRSGGEASQAMRICGADNLSRIETCLDGAESFLLSRGEARAVADAQVAEIKASWQEVCDEAALPVADRRFLWKRQFLNDFAFSRAP